MRELLCFYVPCPDEVSAQKLISALIDARLIACGNIIPTKSTYLWNGAFETSDESIAFLKTTLIKEINVEQMIETIHPYEIPCIARWKISSNARYAKWVEEMVS